MEYFLTVPHWLDAMTGLMEVSVERLRAALPSSRGTPGTAAPLPAKVPPKAAPSGSKILVVAVLTALLIAWGARGYWWTQQQEPSTTGDVTDTTPLEPKPATKVWVVSIGISEYERESTRLRYAAKDAQQLSAFFGSAGAGANSRYQAVETLPILLVAD